ncbi:gamma-glutamylcyclotransferase family protein, partial [Bernardetia sp.]|uniref:gamma-glutamylcyclotransferase family protein n=1 Tax=Bernardetia sp. TaxID=1937974 RepID=UPI0025C00CD0
MHYLFSYGTLQKEKVQLSSFGRILEGFEDMIVGYKLEQLEITSEEVLAKSEQKFHPIAIKTSNPNAKIEGMVYEISDEELALADSYEVSDYKRILVHSALG